MDSRDAWQLDGEDLKSEVLDLVRARHELQSQMVLLIVEMFSREVLGGKGFRAIAQWLHGSTNLEIGECSLLVGLARLLMLEPVVADAFHRGDVDALKARQVASFCQHPPKNMTLADVDKARGILLGLASKNIADCDAVRAAIRRIEKQYGKREDGVPVGEDSERNEFYASKGLYGRVTVKGDLDAVNGARLITLLSSLSAPTPEKDGVKDTRTPALRRADGFCELLRRYERAGLGPIEGGVKPHITVTASAKDMTDLKVLKDLLPSTEELVFAWTDWEGRSVSTLPGCWPATAPSPEFCWMKMVFRSTAVRKREQQRCRSGGRWQFVMAVCVPGMRDSVGVVRCPSYRSLERWWPNRSRQSDLVVRSSPPDDAPHGVAGGDRTGSKNSVLSTDVDRSVPAADRREQPTHSSLNGRN